MKRYIYILGLLLCLYVSANAQEKDENQILKCVYLEEAVNLADQPDNVQKDEFVLLMDDNLSAFYSQYNRSRQVAKDSLLRMGLSAIEVAARVNSMPKGKSIEIYRNQPESGRYLHYEQIASDFRFEDAIPQIAWVMGEQTKEILGHTCQKAVGTLYGREWTVWFAMDIPLFHGPWLLAGLPGLILEAVDSDNLFHFTAIELGNGDSLSVEPTDKKSIKCTRDELMKQRKKMDEDLIGTLQAAMGGKIVMVSRANGKPMQAGELKRKANYYEK